MSNRIRLKQSTHKSPLETEDESSDAFKKGIAPEVMIVFGKYHQCRLSPCECKDTVPCEYCIQANLLFLEKKPSAEDKAIDKIISFIKENGIRKTARDLGIDHSTVKYWLKSRNIPQWVVKKYARVGE